MSIIEGEVLGSRFIRELLALVDRGEADDSVHLTTERDRLHSEVENLVKSIAAGVPPATVAPAIAERESQIAALEARLRRPRQVPPDLVRLKAALEQRAEDWKRDLRAEPQVARMVVRRLVTPIVLHDESERPGWMRWESAPTFGLLDGLAPTPARLLASPRGPGRFLRSAGRLEPPSSPWPAPTGNPVLIESSFSGSKGSLLVDVLDGAVELFEGAAKRSRQGVGGVS